jgi:tetratricopeptide (TPR) repeat protein
MKNYHTHWFCLLLSFTFIFNFQPNASAASAGDWRKYRDGARASAQANDFDSALEQYGLAFKEAEAAFKGTDVRFLDTVAEAANFHVQLRRFDAAIQMYQTALDRMPKAKGAEQSYKAAFLTEIGNAYVYARKLDAAEESFQSAVKYAEEKLGSRNVLLAEALRGLASVHIERKEPDQALPILKRALNIAAGSAYGGNFDGMQYQARSGPSTTEYSIQNTIGILHLSQSNYVEAEKAFREALGLVNRQRANTQINFIKANTASMLINLAQAHRGQGEYREAEDALMRSIDVAEQLNGSAIAIGQAATLLAQVHFEQNDSQLDRLLARLNSKKSGEPDPKNFFSYTEVMARQYARQDWPRARALIQKARSTAPQFSAQLANLGAKLAIEHKDSKSAQEFLTDCVAELKKSQGSDSALIGPLKELADLQSASGNTEAAQKSYEETVAAARAAFGTKDSRLANALDDQAVFLEKAGKKTEAAAARAEANQVRTASFQR